ncbi:MAG: peptidoglycan DD-metalloendopeptidase family protein [Acidimicrobiales bacterium]
MAAAIVVVPQAAAAQPPSTVTYIAPVAAPIIDPFRPPATPYGAGNRGIEYDTVPGASVVAAAAGTVVFAGAVAGALHVTVLDADGVRTSYSYLATIEVTRGQRVEQGQAVGTSGETFHFGARIGDAYIDPAALLGGQTGDIALVPHDTPFPSRPPPPGGRAAVSTTVAWLREATAGVLPPGTIPQPIVDLAVVLADWKARQANCTPAREPIAPPPPGRRVAVLVGGLGSSSTEAAIDALDTTQLGYHPGDVVRFSYAGGRVPGTGAALGSVPGRPYTGADTLGDLRAAADRLADLVADLAMAAPDARIDLLGHSQGGVVTRLALQGLAERSRAGVDALDHLGVVVTLGSPHQGSDLATLVRLTRAIPGGDVVLEGVQHAVGLPIEADSPAAAQLAEGSDLLDQLAATPLPSDVPVLSIGARGDIVVAAPRTRLAGATNVIVSVGGLVTDHERLPATPAVLREIGLVRARRPPGCEGLLDAVADAVGGAGIGWGESGFSLLPAGGAAW